MKIPPNFGRYEVLDLISQGGMGTLYRARDPRIGRYVAVKVLKRSFDTPELRDRFSREARAAGCLSHPNIVTIYDVGEHEGLPFIAMEYVRGETFVELVGLKPPLPVDRKLQLIEEVCAGLTHAHEAGIVHRDIKPANLILSSEGTVKILDFGIAKLSSAGLTMPGSIMGTLNYMSPEQAKGDPVDARTDIFAVGVVTYELLSHQPAFTGKYPTEALHKILNDAPTPITEYCPDLDPRVVELIARTLNKDPDKRFQTVAAVGKAIAAIRRDSPRVTATMPRRTPRPTVKTTTDSATARADQIDEYLAASERAFDAGDYDGALEACKQVLLLDSSNERALAELDRVQAAVDERHAAVEAAVERGRAAFATGNLMSALREVKQALALDPADQDALALSAQTEQAIKERQEEGRIRAAVGAARRQFAAGDHRAALAALDAVQPATHPLVHAAREELRQALDQIEEQQQVEAELIEQRRRTAALGADALSAIGAGRLKDAARILTEIRDVDPSAVQIAEVTERLRQAQVEARRSEEAERRLADVDASLAEGNLARAEEALAAAAALAPQHPRLATAKQRVADATAAAAARAAAEARARQAEEALDAAAARLQADDLAAATGFLQQAADLAPDHPRHADLSEQLRAAVERRAAAEAAERLRRDVEALVRNASTRLDAAAGNPAELPLALGEVNRALELDPGDAEAARVKSAIEAAIAARREAARVRAAVDNAGRRFANGKHHAAIKLLEEFDPPDHPDIVRARDQLRASLAIIEERRRAERERVERQQRIAALITDARAALDEGRFDEGLQLIATAAEIDATTADLAPLREEILRAQSAARLRAEIGEVVAEIDERLSNDDVDAARDLLNRATALSAVDGAVVAARRRVEAAIEQRDARVAREREEAAAREREAAAAREREAAAAREREAAAAREREAAAAREREAAAAREREAVAAREREAAAAREREAAATREREAAAAREREVAAARQREAATGSDADARAQSAARERQVAADRAAETLFAGDLQDAVRAALESARRGTAAPQEPTGGTGNPPAADRERARRTADELLAAARAQLAAPSLQIADVTSALHKIEQALAAVPEDTEALALETAANENLARLRDAAKIDASIRNARSRFAIGKHHSAIQLLEGLDPGAHPTVAAALRELRTALQAIEERRRQAEADAKRPKIVDDDATHVIVMPEILAKMPADGAAPVAVATDLRTGSPVADPAPATVSASSEAESQRRLMVFGGVLLLLVIIAAIILRFAP